MNNPTRKFNSAKSIHVGPTGLNILFPYVPTPATDPAQKTEDSSDGFPEARAPLSSIEQARRCGPVSEALDKLGWKQDAEKCSFVYPSKPELDIPYTDIGGYTATDFVDKLIRSGKLSVI